MAQRRKDIRTPDRAAMVPFRMSHEQRRDLDERAERMGLTRQALLEHLVFGIENPEVRQGCAPRPHLRRQREELPIKTA